MKRWITISLSVLLAATVGLTAFATLNREELDAYLKEEYSRELEAFVQLLYGEDAKDWITASEESYTDYEAYEKVEQMYTEEQKKIMQESNEQHRKLLLEDESLRPIPPEEEGHTYQLKRTVQEKYASPNTGIYLDKLTYTYVCEDCGKTVEDVKVVK